MEWQELNEGLHKCFGYPPQLETDQPPNRVQNLREYLTVLSTKDQLKEVKDLVLNWVDQLEGLATDVEGADGDKEGATVGNEGGAVADTEGGAVVDEGPSVAAVEEEMDIEQERPVLVAPLSEPASSATKVVEILKNVSMHSTINSVDNIWLYE